jgi:hypothetical protein
MTLFDPRGGKGGVFRGGVALGERKIPKRTRFLINFDPRMM